MLLLRFRKEEGKKKKKKKFISSYSGFFIYRRRLSTPLTFWDYAPVFNSATTDARHLAQSCTGVTC
jgi:hypothetical protein